MPVGDYSKDEIRADCRENRLDSGSQAGQPGDLFCAGSVIMPDSLTRHTGKKMPEGNFVTPDGKVIGRHKGITHYTVGQRKKLGLAYGASGVCQRDPPQDQ